MRLPFVRLAPGCLAIKSDNPLISQKKKLTHNPETPPLHEERDAKKVDIVCFKCESPPKTV